MTKNNPETLAEQRAAIVSKMDTSQLSYSSNRVSVTEEMDNSPDAFVINEGVNYANHPVGKCDADPVLLEETRRFAKEHIYKVKRYD